MADRTWQIEHRGEFRLALRRATSLPRGNKRDYVSYKTLVRWRFACALRGSARGFWFIDPLGLRPRGLCTVATRACHVNHAPASYNYNMLPVYNLQELCDEVSVLGKLLLKLDHHQQSDLPQGVERPIIPRSHPIVQYPCHCLHVCACVYIHVFFFVFFCFFFALRN